MRPCILCNGTKFLPVTDKLRFGLRAQVLRCEGCGLILLDQDSFEFPKNFYETEYHQTYLTHVDPEMLDPQTYYEKMCRVAEPWIHKVKEHLTGSETVLDVGCSTGHLLMGIKNHCAQVYGHELSQKEIKFCKEQLKLDVSDVPLDQRFSTHTFDLITMIFVLEHIGDPVNFLASFKKYLKPGGKLLVLVPNIKDPLVSLYNLETFREFYYCIEHLFYYSPDTLAKTMQLAGYFSFVEAIQEYPISNHLNWNYCNKPRESLSARHISPITALHDDINRQWLDRFWEETNNRYKDALRQSGFADRIWCVAEVNNDRM